MVKEPQHVGGGEGGFHKDRSDWSDTWFAWSTCNSWPPSPNAFHCLSPTWIPETNSNTCVKCEIWSARSFFSHSSFHSIALRSVWIKPTLVSAETEKNVYFYTISSASPAWIPLESQKTPVSVIFRGNQLNFKWGMRDKNRPEKPFLSLWSVSRFRTRLPSYFIPLPVPRGAKARS